VHSRPVDQGRRASTPTELQLGAPSWITPKSSLTYAGISNKMQPSPLGRGRSSFIERG
jgi:hypothetical protein